MPSLWFEPTIIRLFPPSNQHPNPFNWHTTFYNTDFRDYKPFNSEHAIRLCWCLFFLYTSLWWKTIISIPHTFFGTNPHINIYRLPYFIGIVYLYMVYIATNILWPYSLIEWEGWKEGCEKYIYTCYNTPQYTWLIR